MTQKIYCDGSIIDKGKTSEVFLALVADQEGLVETKGCHAGEYRNSSVLSEYMAILNAINMAERYTDGEVIIYGDCLPVITNIQERNNPHSTETLRNVNNEIVKTLKNTDKILRIEHIDRSKNKRADEACEIVKNNYENLRYLKMADPNLEIEKIGRENYRVGNHEVKKNENYCSCFSSKEWKYEDRHTKKCEHIFTIEKEKGKTHLHPQPDNWMVTDI